MKSKLLCSVLVFMSTFILLAQQDDFVGNTWYLEKLVINGEDHFLPQNEEINESTLEIDSINSVFHIDFCYGGMADGLSFPDDNNFTIDNFYAPAMACEITENNYYQGLYFNFIWDNSTYSFHYSITGEGDNLKKLVITGNNNNQVVYYNTSLSVQDIEELHFRIYPNPTKDFIYIESKTTPLKIEIYDISGKICLVQELNKSSDNINTTRLSSGVYFLKVTNNNTVKITRIIKN